MNETIFYRLKNLIDHSIISISKNPFKIGRATTNDLSIENNRYISSCHCILEYNNGHVYINDTSSNGTLINRSKKIQKNTSPIELQSGDIIHLVFRKDEPSANLIYQLELVKSNNTIKRKNSETKENVDLNPDTEMKRIKINEDTEMNAADDMENILTCVCCQDIMINPICLEPCLHAFCNDCYASWEVVQRTCPKCRVKVTGKKKNVVINGILEAFFKAYPQKRPALKTIENSKCQTTNTKLKINQNTISSNRTIQNDEDDEDEDDEDEDEDDEDDEDDDDDDEEENTDHFVVMMTTPARNIQIVCRQCPTVNRRNSNIHSTNFQCRLGQNHILCQCCLQPMPDRQDESDIDQSCEICHQYFCNMYFEQCQRQDCLGCLQPLRNFNFPHRHLINIVNDNPVETQILQNFLTAHRLSMQEFFLECCRRLDRKEFKCVNIDPNTPVPSKKIVCYKCALNIFKQLAYQFRVSMKPTDILPITMRNREDCYYGKQCRTQYTKPAHAQKLNHACDQIKF